MDLMEYQAKQLFAKHGVPVTVGTVITDPSEAAAAAEAEGGRVVVKAQVKTGGRGKAGGVKLAQDPQDAVAKAEQILGMDIKGHTVNRVLIAPAADIAEEYYFSFLVDRAARQYLCIASVEGGVRSRSRRSRSPKRLPSSGSTRWSASTRPRPARSSRLPASPPRSPTKRSR